MLGKCALYVPGPEGGVCGGGVDLEVYSMTAGIGKSLVSLFLKFLLLVKQAKTQKDRAGLVLGGCRFSPCLLPHPALPTLAVGHLLLSLLSGEEKGWSQGAGHCSSSHLALEEPPSISSPVEAGLTCT